MRNYHLRLAKALASLLDDQFEILGVKFGLDPLFDLIPGLGDVVSNLLSFYIVWVGKELGLPREKILQMLINIALDFIIGLVPVAGAIGTVFFRSNRMNIRIIEDYLRETKVEEGVIVR